MRFLIIALVSILISSFSSADSAQARPKHLFKISTLAPEGTVWVTQFRKFADEVTEKTNGEVGFRIYAGGVQGDDQAMYRKMRVGQLHGGGFTMTGIAAVVPDFRVMSIPFLFTTYEQVDAVRSGLVPIFKKRFNEKGMEFIAMTEVGFIYTMSTKPIATAAELKESTNWMPAGDPLAAAFLQNIGITPVQLSIPDVLSSLQTGLIDTVYNSLYGSIVMQWFTKAKYITDTPFGYAYGVFLLDKKKFSKLSDEQQEIVKSSATKHFSVLIDDTRKSNSESRQVMKDRGVEFIAADNASITELRNHHMQTVEKLKGEAFSEEIFDKTIELLNAYNAAQPVEKKQ